MDPIEVSICIERTCWSEHLASTAKIWKYFVEISKSSMLTRYTHCQPYANAFKIQKMCTKSVRKWTSVAVQNIQCYSVCPGKNILHYSKANHANVLCHAFSKPSWITMNRLTDAVVKLKYYADAQNQILWSQSTTNIFIFIYNGDSTVCFWTKLGHRSPSKSRAKRDVPAKAKTQVSARVAKPAIRLKKNKSRYFMNKGTTAHILPTIEHWKW